MDTQNANVRLAALVPTRPEFSSIERVWTDVLEPELNKREATRLGILARLKSQGAIAAMASLGVLVLLMVAGMGGILLMVIWFFVTAGLVAFLVGPAAAQLQSAKTQTKDLILSAACAPFGFSYDSLHPDLSGIKDRKSALDEIKRWGEQKQAELEEKGQLKRFKVLGVDVSVGTETSGPQCPTPAYDILRTAKLLPANDERKFEDLIIGERAGVQFELIEARLRNEDSDDNSKTTVFQGLLFHFKFPDNFFGQTVIARSSLFSWFSKPRGLEEVDLVSVDLARDFKVWSNDQVEARALLTPDRMERLIALEQHFKGGKLRGVFDGGHVTLALEAPDQFEAGSIFQPLVDVTRFTSALEELGLVCDVLDGLLTRDWAKGRI